MRRALELAFEGRGGTHPNPLVGAVVVRDGRVVGEGYHARLGGPHAEVIALNAAGGGARGATLYVTLEPCAHHGRTPPCTDAIIAAGVTRVVHAAPDPNPMAAGGAVVLAAAGIHVTGGVEEEAARSQNAIFFHTHESAGPWVSLKLAVSLDGGIAAGPGLRTQLTGTAAQEETHRLRASHDAVVIGSRTARIDDPLLTVRTFTPPRQPVRVVLDSHAGLSLESRLVRTAADADVLLLCAPDAPVSRTRALARAGVRIRTVAADDRGLAPAAVMESLTAEGISSVLVEGGSRLGASLLHGHCVHRLHLFIAPRFLGPGAVPAFPLPGPLAGWHCTGSRRCGSDAWLTFDPVPTA